MEAPRSRAARRLTAFSVGVNLAALVFIGALLLRSKGGGAVRLEDSRRALLTDPELREQLLRELASQAVGINDSHVDPEVGRVLLPLMNQESLRGESIATNRLGMREREYELPKPLGKKRIVLLGDSFVFGFKVQAEERLSARLEALLAARAGSSGTPPEVLGLGVTGWNVVSECAYLRRQLDLLQPDLVLHVITGNDLDDGMGVRGVGVPSTFTPARRSHADARISRVNLIPSTGGASVNPLLLGLDEESRALRAEAQSAIARLAEAVATIGGVYRPIVYDAEVDPALLRDALLPTELGRDALCARPSFSTNPAHHVDRHDAHWSPLASERLAQALLAWMDATPAVRALGLVPDGPHAASDASKFDEVFALGAELPSVDAQGLLHAFPGLNQEFLAAVFADGEAQHVYAGLDETGDVGVYASLVLAPVATAAARRLVVEGEALDRSELEGASVRIIVEGQAVGELRLPRRGPIQARFELPAGTADRPLVNVRFEAADHVLVGPFLQECAVFRLQRLALEP